mmetsp:Transcript_17861/g.24529  ORF Transcript_17861/g.24529 Transcript_17861/m.24529 type:complete len:90 (-) Transcript_17861:643-912(-)
MKRDKCVSGTSCVLQTPFYYQCTEVNVPSTGCTPTNSGGCTHPTQPSLPCCNSQATCVAGKCLLNQYCVWFPPYSGPALAADLPQVHAV